MMRMAKLCVDFRKVQIVKYVKNEVIGLLVIINVRDLHVYNQYKKINK